METTATRTRILRVDLPSRLRAQSIRSKERKLELNEEEEDLAREALAEQRKGRAIMGKDHRFFHRRAAQAATQVVTVNVEVIATVDSNGDLVAQETVTQQSPSLPTGVAEAVDLVPSVPTPAAEVVQSVPSIVADAVNLVVPVPSVVAAAADSAPSVFSIVAQAVPVQPSVPSVPAVPSVPPAVLPSVPAIPSVPPFPSDLVVPSVPPYPWASGVPVVQAAASTDLVNPSPALTSGTVSTTVPAPGPISAANPEVNSTMPSNTASFLATSSVIGLGSIPTSPPTPASQSLDPSHKASLSGTITENISGRSASATDSAPTTYYGGGGRGAPGNPAVPSASTTAATSGADAGGSPAPLETPQVVGSVVGSLAGAALILAIILLLIRRHKRKRGGVLQLTGDDHTDNDLPMRQAPLSSSTVPSAFLHRFSGMSRSTAETSTSGGERSFQRISGRKLPSAFSEGMTSEQFSRGGTMSGSSFYQDDQGIYGGSGVSKEFGKEIGDTSVARTSGPINFRPSPARTPIIRHPDDNPIFGTNRSHLSPPHSPNPDLHPIGTLGRSLPSADGSRSSRFTENV